MAKDKNVDIDKLKERLAEAEKKLIETKGKEEQKEVINEDEMWSIQEVPAQFTPAIVNLKTKEVLDANQALIRILNSLEKILKLAKE